MSRVVRSAGAGLGLIACAVLAGCAGASGESYTSPTMSAVTGTNLPPACSVFPGFDLPKDNPNPHGSTPALALAAFLDHGSIFGAVSPIENPAAAQYATTGYALVSSDASTATFQSGFSRLTFTRVHGSWVITSGQKDC